MKEAFRSLTWGKVTTFVVLYLALCYLALASIGAPDQVSLLWPASGLALAFALRYGLIWCLPLAVALFLFHSLFEREPGLLTVVSIGANVGGLVAALLYLRWRGEERMLSIRGGFLLLQAAMLMSLVSGLVGIGGLGLIGDPAGNLFWPSVLQWALGDLLGIVCITPATLLALSRTRESVEAAAELDYAGARGKLLWLVLLTLSLLLIFMSGFGRSSYVLGLSVVPVALVVWSAIRLPPIWTAFGNAVTGLAIANMIGLGLSGFEPPTEMTDRLYLLVFLVLLALFPMILMASTHEIRKSSRQLFHRATTDIDTGLPNRTAFEVTARGLLDSTGAPWTLGYLDFDHFTLVNDTASHAAGDALIKAVASLLGTSLYPGDRVFRIGGDEFALLFQCQGREAELRAERVLRAVESFRTGWDGHILSTTASIGLATLKPGQGDYAQLLSQADAACFTAKELGGNRLCIADQNSAALQDRTDAMQWAVRIRQALNQNLFELHCQDIRTLGDGAGQGRHFEILLRLREPGSGRLLPPGLFIPAAERFQLGPKIDRHVIDLVLGWMEAHPAEARTVSACAINLSAGSMQDESFAPFLRERLSRSSFPAYKIIFEITETSAMHDLAHAQALIAELRRLGCRFALDDFGSGFCSFKYLQTLDVDIFKIDGGFVRDMQTSELSQSVIRAITEIAHVLKKTTVAEHCETEELGTQLRALGVDKVQGFGIHRPQPIDDYFAA
ncbi:putative bifunctional diguanylate cyclase/phosphodiesterase [Arenimonas maotaiensis]|uniref:putative bifunctional diguanylate cyclase/phosphodiesterase n=1 Tax=Arenimonas maotaiensis TaxID=1446479 RepID=UPI001664284B|nr:EAL domain-containing protein [Arenimonas maotaiensis]